MITIIGKGKDSRNLANLLGCKRFNRNADVIIRYGNIREGFEGITINSIEAIKRTRNKLIALTILSNEGISTPEFHKRGELEGSNGIWFGRETFHKKGKDIVICEQKDDGIEILNNVSAEKITHLTKYIPVDREYRVHVMGNEVIQVCIKIPDDNTHEKDMIRNLEHGWHFAECNDWVNMYKKMKQMAIDSVNILGLDFGAVDIILGKDGKYYVLEVNTAPGLDNKRLELYVENLTKLIILKTTKPVNIKLPAKIIWPDWFHDITTDFFNHRNSYKFLQDYFSHVTT